MSKSIVCATALCDRRAVGRFEAGGVGSDHCQQCLNAIQSLRSQPAGVRVVVGGGWETHSLEDKQRLQKDAGIPNLPTDMTYEARMAVSGEGPRAYEWSDKKHRLVYDLCREIERLAALEPQQEEAVAFGVFLNDGRFMCIAEINEDDAITQAENFYETGDYHIRPLYAHPTPVQKVQESQTVSEEMVERLRDAHENSQQRVAGSNIFAEAADRIEALSAKLKLAEAALEFYGDVSKYPAPLTGGMGDLWSDCGSIARAALNASPPAEPNPQ